MNRIAFCFSLVSACAANAPEQSADTVKNWEQAMLRADAQVRRAGYADALTELMSAVKIAEALGPDGRRLNLALDRLGAVYCETGRYRKAEQTFLRILDLLDNVPSTALDRAVAFDGLTTVYTQTGEYSKAERFGRMAIAVREKELGANHGKLGAPLQNLAAVYHSERRYDEAEALYRRGLQVLDNDARPATMTTASIHNNLARLLGETGRFEQGIEHATRAVFEWGQLLGPEHPQVARGLDNLANLYCRAHRWSEAEGPVQRAIRITSASSGEHDWRLEPILRTYAEILMHTGRKQQGKQMLRDADEIRRQFNLDNRIGYTVDVKGRFFQ